ncbi:MAG TPA: DUF4097 family beta strand repeat-containing protein [Steroidobacteraceae bacterium]|nr:DUF4097 family beta strand repeat-containing protein [Steroidobacteraceae bacterium]
MSYKSILALGLGLFASLNASANVTRNRVEDFSVESGAHVDIKISGGAINVKVGTEGKVHIELHQTARTNSDKEAEEWIARVNPVVEKTARGVRVLVRHDGNQNGWWWFGHREEVQVGVDLVVPPSVNLDLNTSGGSINVNGQVQGDLHADTSGGSITITGAVGKIDLDTSGGNISVDHVVKYVHADTSGGSIHIGYVDPGASDVDADTSGGSIKIGIDPSGNYDVYADTSGGHVKVSELSFEALKTGPSHLEGRVNRGGMKVRADTSGGNIEIYAAHP